MTIKELAHILTELKIDKDDYSICLETFPNDKLCIVKNDLWEVYYSERGRKSNLHKFQSESEACEYFLSELIDAYE